MGTEALVGRGSVSAKGAVGRVVNRILVPQLGTEPPRELPPWRLFEELLSGEKVFKKLTP